MREGVLYQRGLNGRIVAKWIDQPGGRQRRWLSEPEADSLQGEAHQKMLALHDDLEAGCLHFDPPLERSALECLSRIAALSNRELSGDIERFRSIYRPVGILPPDQYQAVLLQATEGCSHNQCTFCDFYKNQRFHIKDEREFRLHCQDVTDFLGQGLSLRRTIFLGDANALVVPLKKLVVFLTIVNEIFDVTALGGIYAFQDAFSGDRKDAADYAQLRAFGLERVYLGLESGHDPLLNILQKPGTSNQALHAVQALKTAGVRVGVIILLGAGGKTFADRHVRDTIRVLNQMDLNLHDQIYFSELVESEGMKYTRAAIHPELQPLGERDLQRQAEQIEASLSFGLEGGTPHISRYDIREFIY